MFHYWVTPLKYPLLPEWLAFIQFPHQLSPEFPLNSTWLTYIQTTECAAAASVSSDKHESELHFLSLIFRVLTLCFYPPCRSHPLCGTLWLWGTDRRRPQLQERRKVPDYQQHVSHYSCLSACLHLGGMLWKGMVLLGVEQTGRSFSAEVKVAACTGERRVLVPSSGTSYSTK